jgi:hypothetical protein
LTWLDHRVGEACGLGIMSRVGSTVSYCAPWCNPVTMTGIVGDEHSDDVADETGLHRRRVRELTLSLDPDGQWGGVTMTTLNLEKDYFVIGEEKWSVERVIAVDPNFVVLGMLFNQRVEMGGKVRK